MSENITLKTLKAERDTLVMSIQKNVLAGEEVADLRMELEILTKKVAEEQRKYDAEQVSIARLDQSRRMKKFNEWSRKVADVGLLYGTIPGGIIEAYTQMVTLLEVLGYISTPSKPHIPNVQVQKEDDHWIALVGQCGYDSFNFTIIFTLEANVSRFLSTAQVIDYHYHPDTSNGRTAVPLTAAFVFAELFRAVHEIGKE